MVSETSLLIQSSIATAISNLLSDSRDEFSTQERTEGWTEIFGADEDDSVVDATEECWKVESSDAVKLFSSESTLIFPDVTVFIIQYRPAWIEQLMMRIAGIPHLVTNSSYASHEATGPLPLLREFKFNCTPIQMGRRHPRLRHTVAENDNEGTSKIADNCIVDFLKSEKGVDLDSNLQSSDTIRTKRNQTTAQLLSLMISTTLHKCLITFRYQDRDAWDQIYRKQCWDSSSSFKSTTGRFHVPSVRAVYQAWSERVMARKNLQSVDDKLSLAEAKMKARNAYKVLEQVLSERSDDRLFLIGTAKPAMVDCLLWAHLADALCDVNLVVILADYPLLVQYFQRIYDSYFGSTSLSLDDADAWKMWNQRENLQNSFHQIPLESISERDTNKDDDDDGDPTKWKHALDLMQKLSVQDHNLLEVLQVGKESRANEQELFRQRLQRWRKKKTATPSPKPDPKDAELTPLEKARREQERQDQYWISLVVGVSVLASISAVAKMVSEAE